MTALNAPSASRKYVLEGYYGEVGLIKIHLMELFTKEHMFCIICDR